jgi:hypothetical protein
VILSLDIDLDININHFAWIFLLERRGLKSPGREDKNGVMKSMELN